MCPNVSPFSSTTTVTNRYNQTAGNCSLSESEQEIKISQDTDTLRVNLTRVSRDHIENRGD